MLKLSRPALAAGGPSSVPRQTRALRPQQTPSQRQQRGRWRSECSAQFDAGWGSAVDTQSKGKRAALLEYVNTVDLALIDKFSEQAPATVVDALRTTVRGSLGTLPPQFFHVQISSRTDSFAQLLYSHMMAGYMFRNALFRMELRGALVLPVLPPGESGSDGGAQQAAPAVPAEEQLDVWAPGTQLTRVSGDVLRWHMERGTQAIPAREYIEDLEAEIRALKQQVASVRSGASNTNELLDYIQSLGPDADVLTANASPDVLAAMNAFVDRCIGPNDQVDMAAMAEYDVNELAPQLLFTAIIGYMLRSLEVRYDIQSSLDDGDTTDLLPGGS